LGRELLDQANDEVHDPPRHGPSWVPIRVVDGDADARRPGAGQNRGGELLELGPAKATGLKVIGRGEVRRGENIEVDVQPEFTFPDRFEGLDRGALRPARRNAPIVEKQRNVRGDRRPAPFGDLVGVTGAEQGNARAGYKRRPSGEGRGQVRDQPEGDAQFGIGCFAGLSQRRPPGILVAVEHHQAGPSSGPDGSQGAQQHGAVAPDHQRNAAAIAN
jgi:hypothetical protein